MIKPLALAPLMLTVPSVLLAQTMVLDAEFDDYARRLTTPLLPKLPHTEGMGFVLIADDDLNAYVDTEKVVHINSGLFLNAKGGNDVQGVMAHELGHISSQHVQRMQDHIDTTAGLPMLAGAVVGVGAVLAGAPQVGAAAMIGGQAASISNILQFSRTQESEADQRAIAALHGAGYSAQGMVNTFERLRTDSQLSYGSLPPYLLTHPLPQARLQSLANAVAKETVSKTPSEAEFERMQAKVYALTHTPAATLRRYNGTDANSRYARALAYVGLGKLDDAARENTTLLQQKPNDVFYQELAAQIAVQRGKLADAAEGFSRILATRPDLMLIRFQLAETQRALGQTQTALANYRKITQDWQVWAEPWHGMGLCYGMLGNLPFSHLALAQAAVYSADTDEAKAQLALAQNYLKKTPNPEAESWAKVLDDALNKK